MKNKFRAFRIHNDQGKHRAGIEQLNLNDLSPGEVVIESAYSGVNYKDALAGTGKGKILRRFPLVGGIDVSGEVVHSDSTQFKTGDEVLITGCGLSESYDGGFAEYVRAPADCVVCIEGIWKDRARDRGHPEGILSYIQCRRRIQHQH